MIVDISVSKDIINCEEICPKCQDTSITVNIDQTKKKGLSSPILYVNGLQIIIQVEKLKMIQK